jgi:hypothetical protein
VTQSNAPTQHRRAFAPVALAFALALAGCARNEPAPAPVAVAAPAPVAAPLPPPAPALTDAQVRDVLARIEAAARKHDANALGAVFTDDAKFTVTPYEMETRLYNRDEYLAYLRKQYARNAGAQESHNLVKLVVRTDGGAATARINATSMLSVNGYPISQVEDQFYTVELRDNEPKVVSLVIQGMGVAAGGHQ